MQLPGTSVQQKIIKKVSELLARDKNVRALILFGSLARGNWDEYSDVDLDVIVRDASQKRLAAEAARIRKACAAADLKVLSSFKESADDFVFIFDTLDRMSIRFHLLEDTSPVVVQSMKLLFGDLGRSKIKGSRRQPAQEGNCRFSHHKFLEHSIYFQLSLRRHRLLNAFFFLNRMRQMMIEIYTQTRGKRIFDFESLADDKLKRAISQTYSSLKQNELEKSFRKLIDLYRGAIVQMSRGKIRLSQDERTILRKVVSY